MIQYEAYFNRFEMALGTRALADLSHNWGMIWVSLTDKQIEHATLNEHVSIRIGEDDAATRQVALRIGKLEKLCD